MSRGRSAHMAKVSANRTSLPAQSTVVLGRSMTAGQPRCTFARRGFEGTSSPMRTVAQYALMAACLLFAARPATAEDDAARYPTRPIHIIVGFAAGGGNAVIARIFAQKLSEDLVQPVIVENKPGAGAIVA